MSICVHLWFFLLLLITAAPAADADTAFRDAVAAYKAGEYQKALDDFKKIAADDKQISAALCHNLANCEYRLGEAAVGDGKDAKRESESHFGQAGLWYRRALALDPSLAEARQNLRFLERAKGFHVFKATGLAEFAARLPRWKWMTACQVSIWTAAIAIVWLAWATPRPGRRWPLVSLLSLAIAAGIAAGCGLYGKAHDPAPFAKRLVNIVSPENYLRTAPAEAAATVITLQPGSELLPLHEEGYWTYCQMPSESSTPLRGWIRTDQTEKLWPWPASLVE